MTRGRYACFFHPKEDMSEHEITDPCPECGRPYSYPLDNGPSTIGQYRIERPLGRGFYAATYLATYGGLGRKAVLKVTPKETYAYFGKDFNVESRLHLEVSDGTQHLAGISDVLDETVRFGDVEIPCHIAQLDYIEGPTLAEFLSDTSNRTARNLAQIAVDLFSLMRELKTKQKYHNDLHEKNIIIQELDKDSYRSGETIEPSIRAVAIDLGSLAEASKSVPVDQRLGDLLHVVRHILNFRDYLLNKPNETSDLEYRLAVQLDQIGHLLSTEPAAQREPPLDEIITGILEGYGRSSSPWQAPSELKSFSESYNAQTLHPSFVRKLLVDPDKEWLPMVSGNGPQVITGIRGCGKTMLLKALQSHSQISHYFDDDRYDTETAVDKIRSEGYIGLYVPTNRLLDTLGSTPGPVHEPFARLYVAYAWEALKAARHLSEYQSDLVSPGYWRHIGRVVTGYVKGTSGLHDTPTATWLENGLFSILVSLDRGEDIYKLGASPAVAFPALAEAVRLMSDVWKDATVLFLLDDVSTRNLSEADTGRLLGTLLFANPHCAFKMTTEVQTMELILKSPGLIETARVGRDYDTFDLAARVTDKLNDRKGPEFVERILNSRAEFYPKNTGYSPSQLLGEDTLQQIARDIATTNENSPKKKAVYRGIRALTSLCVGDIGDILKIYESILKHFDGTSVPIPYEKQSGEFQEYCSKQLYHLNRRDGELKDFALSFAKAAHRLLVKSATPSETDSRGELRQYTQLYVRITTGDMEWQFERLRELIDAGVFVLRRGPDVPRTKTRDANPTQYFILSYRKLYGLSSFIGLSNRDRFELSGQDLIDWLGNPASGEEILGRNLGLRGGSDLVGHIVPDGADSASEGEIAPPDTTEQPEAADGTQMPLFNPVGMTRNGEPEHNGHREIHKSTPGHAGPRMPVVVEVPRIETEAGSTPVVVTSLGFEERTLESSKLLFSKIRAASTVLVRYPVPGYADEIRALAKKASANLKEVNHDEVNQEGFELPEGEVIVDVTGLAKPAIFKVVSQALARDRTVVVAHTQAKAYYPLDKDIDPILEPNPSSDMFNTLEKAREIWTGEKGPYQFVRLLNPDVDQTRRRLLCAGVSPQHERLLSFVEERDYDGLSIIEPTGDTPRARLARLAADVAVHGRYESNRKEIGSDDLKGIIELLGNQFDEFYTRDGYDIEFGLTGSKMHAVACAAASVVRKIAQCWYVQPAKYDTNRFTEGAKETRFFRISLP